MTTNQKQHIAAAKTLRYAGFNAVIVNNKKEKQPIEIHVKNVDNNTINSITEKMAKLYMNSTLNIIAS